MPKWEVSKLFNYRKQTKFSIMQIDVSIIIPTKNAGNEFDKSLSRIFTQKTKYRYEVIVIDS
ncbi:hypothetical protein CW713_09720, partial [Methanophagales archaeon]